MLFISFSEIVNLLVAGFRLFNLILFKYHLYPIMQISIKIIIYPNPIHFAMIGFHE